MKTFLLALAVLAAPFALLAAPPTLKLPDEIKADAGTFVAIRAESDSPWVNFRADAGLAVFPSDLLSSRKTTVVTAVRDGRYRVFAYTGNEDGGADAIVWVVIGTPPVVVTPPGPGPINPSPPSPGTPLTGMRVLILEETSPAKRLTNMQAETLNSLEVRTYLDSKTNKQWRRFDPDLSLDKLPKELRDLRAKATPTSLPWVIIGDVSSDGSVRVAEQGPYGADGKDKALTLFKKWGG